MVANICGIHWIPTHRDSTDKVTFKSWNPAVFKLVTTDVKIPYLEDVPANSKLLIRHHPMSELNDQRSSPDFIRNPESFGDQHAQMCYSMMTYCEANGIPKSRLLFEGLNEPQLWAGESPAIVNRYYKRFLSNLHNINCNGVIGNFGVGWPGNGGGIGAAVQWSFFEDAISEMRTGDFLGLHEYWALTGVKENWTWWAGRYKQCPYDVPILITETGIDTGVTGTSYGGWRSLPLGTNDAKAARYVDELFEYAQICYDDGRIYCIMPFTYDIGSPHWEQFNLKDQTFLNAWWKRVEKTGYIAAPDFSSLPVPNVFIPTPEPPVVVVPSTEPPIETMRQKLAEVLKVPYTPTYALSVKADEAGLGVRLTDELHVDGWVLQGHALGFVYTKEGDWDLNHITVEVY